MRPNSDAFQSTPLSPQPGAAPAQATPPVPPESESRRAAAAAPTAGPCTGQSPPVGEPSRIGVVLVHGIGTQPATEFFLEGSEPLVRLLSEWRISLGLPLDPVVRSEISFNGASRPYLELQIPANPDQPESQPTTWVVTEAWWATDLRAPSLGEASRWLRSRIATIVRGISKGFSREDRWERRRGEARDEAGDWRQAELGQRRWAWIRRFDRLQLLFTRYALLLTIAPSFLALLIWAPLRAIPIGPLRAFAEARFVDTFLTDWFGDLPLILDDSVQSANVRARLATTVGALRTLGCDAIVLVAHSGGAIVSFATLLDPVYGECHIDKLITLGEALDLGWRLEGAYGRRLPEGHRLRGDPRTNRPGIRWTDFWASYDPAPAGRIISPDVNAIPVVARDPHRYATDRAPARPEEPQNVLIIEDRPVTNYMSLFGDHGAYWDNDEGFLVGLVRQIDRPRGEVDSSRFYRDPVDRAVRIERRRSRVATLAAWRWLVGMGLLLAIVASGVRAYAGPVWNAGTSLEALWGIVPGHELISGPIEAIGQLFGLVFGLLTGATVGAAFAADLGVLLVGGVFIALLFTALFAVGLIPWRSWDADERQAARRERLEPVNRRRAAASMLAMAGGLVLLVYVVAQAMGPVALPVAIAGWLVAVVAVGIVLAGGPRGEVVVTPEAGSA